MSRPLKLAAALAMAAPATAHAQTAATDSSAAQPVPPETPASRVAQLLSGDAEGPVDQLLSEPPRGSIIGGDADDLDQSLGQRQIFSDLRSLEDRISTQQRPVLNAVVQRSTQSDDVDITHAEISQDIFLSNGRSRLRGGFQALRYVADGGDRIIQYAEGGTGNVRISDTVAIAGEAWLNQIKPKGGPTNTTLTYDAYLTLFPNDYFRIDIDTNRRTFDNIVSLRRGIAARSINGSIDYTPSNDLRLTLRGGGSFYNDGNRRQSIETEGVWRVKTKPVLELGLRATAFQFDKLLFDGYFNPKHYVSGEAMARLQWDVSERFTAELAGSGGIERASPGGSKPIVKASLELSYKIFDGWSLDGGVSHFSSRTSNSTGFARTNFTLGLHHRFK